MYYKEKMKMHIQKTKQRTALVLCALLLSFNLISAYTIPTYAVTETETTLTKLIDMILTKTGVVASETILNDIKDDLFELLVSEGDTVIQYHIDNGLELTRESLVDYWENQEGSATGTRKFLIRALMKSDLFIDTLYACYAPYVENIEELVIREKDLLNGLGLYRILTSGAYKIWSEFVELIRALFDKYAESEAEFYYVPTIGPDNINPLWFSEKAYYDWFVAFLGQSDYVYAVQFWKSDSSYKNKMFSSGTDNVFVTTDIYLNKISGDFGLIHSSQPDYLYYFYTYSSDWASMKYYSVVDTVKNLSSAFVNDEEFDSYITSKGVGLSSASSYGSTLERKVNYNTAFLGFCTSDGRSLRVFKDLNAYKKYSVGQQPYYFNQSNDYSVTNDNSIDFNGTYYKDNSETYSYDIIQNEIDNSTEINEETVNNIVNNTTTTIVNNYYGSSGDTDNGNDWEDNLQDMPTDYDDEYVRAEISGLGGALIGIALEHFDTLHDVAVTVRDGMETVTEPINDITEIVGGTIENVNNTATELGEGLQDTGGFFAELYSFIPSDYMNLLMIALVSSIGIALWNRFTG